MENDEGENSTHDVYELCFLILPSIPQDKLISITESIRQIITKVGGKELDAEEPFKHPLAYPISKTVSASRYTVTDAYIGWIKFDVDPVQIMTVRMDIDKMPEILRSLVIKAPLKTSFTFASARKALDTENLDTENIAATPVTEEVDVPATVIESNDTINNDVS